MPKAKQPTEKEIDDLLNDCAEAIEKGRTKFRGMTYEQGIEAGIKWSRGELDEHPLED